MVAFRIPTATYRLQFNKEFRFDDARAIVGYLSKLGITDIYASPLLKARKGSTHGYDIIDPLQLNPELGNHEDFQKLVKDLGRHGMGLLLDIVPNHMALSPDNSWWMDVLENGYASPFADYFDIEWHPRLEVTAGRVVLPVLGASVQEVLERHELTLQLHKDSLYLEYYEIKLPLDIKSYSSIMSIGLNALKAEGENHQLIKRVQQLLQSMNNLPQQGSSNFEKLRFSYKDRQRIKKEFIYLVSTEALFYDVIRNSIRLLNEDTKSLETLLDLQVYQLSFWRTGAEKINYRRFFDINELIGICIEKPHVFERTHGLIKKWVQEDIVTGLRIDHIDGLKNPHEYLQRLQSNLIDEQPAKHSRLYIVVEKILTEDEPLPLEWPISGTTGYDFLNEVNALFVDWAGFQNLEENYKRLIGSTLEFKDVVYLKKKQVITELFISEIKTLSNKLADLATNTQNAHELTERDLTKALVEATACLPVYRTYTNSFDVTSRDRNYIENAITEAQTRATGIKHDALEFLRHVLSLDFTSNDNNAKKDEWLSWVMRWQQFTGAIMAKGLEDTALYCYIPLISLNDVGSKPISINSPIVVFHNSNLVRQSNWPYTMNTTSTHDTKRSEDVRARINVLSEMPVTWNECFIKWSELNNPKKKIVDGNIVPDAVMEMFLYQTLIGAWPLFQDDISFFKERLKSYVIKAARESKTHTSWLSSNNRYESALIGFIEKILEDSEQSRFLNDFLELQRYVAYYGAINSLSQVLLKVTSPGIPDIYQGTEIWGLSLVDPDNRSPVKYEVITEMLSELKRRETEELHELIRELLSTWEDGRIKLYTIYKALNARRVYHNLFLNGDYVPLQAHGKRKENICAFSRRKDDYWALVVVPRLSTKLVSINQLPLGHDVWGDDYLILPDDAPCNWENTFTKEHIQLTSKTRGLPVAQALYTFPVALLMSQP